MEEPFTKAFARHLIPGMLFYLLGLWWYGHFLNIFLVHKNANKEREFHWRALSYYTFVESAVKIVIAAVMALLELSMCRFSLNLDDPEHKGGSLTNFEHFAMYLAFIVSGCVEMLEQMDYLPPRLNFPRLAYTIAFMVLGVNFYFHPNPPGLSRTLHHQIAYVAFLTAFTTVLEGVFPRSISLTLLRAFFCSLAGTWVMQVGYVLFADSAQGKYDDTERCQDFMWFLISIHSLLHVLAFIGIYVLADRYHRARGHRYNKVAFEELKYFYDN